MSRVRNWTCAYCERQQLSTYQNSHLSMTPLEIGEIMPERSALGIVIDATRCLDCSNLTLSTSLVRLRSDRSIIDRLDNTTWQLRPASSARPWPEYIPAILVQDYQESCAIKHLSPKASATLARRCLQGMIRDFCGIAGRTLKAEILELEGMLETGTAPKGVTHETIDAIHAVREVGNIGAHMERDISVIIDVDPQEAQMLISLLEMLFEEWYVARHTRELRLDELKRLAAEKSKSRPAFPSDADRSS